MAKIVVDCDLVLAASDAAWLDWLWRVSCTKGYYSPIDRFNSDSDNGCIDYNLSNYFIEELKAAGRDGAEFWRSTTCYDYVNIVSGAVEYIKKLKQGGHEIVVVSAIKGNHSKSKYQFLERHFKGCIDAYIWTQEKGYIDCDYFIDDRNKFLNMSKAKVGAIKFDTPYTQCEILKTPCNVAEDWCTIYSLINDTEELR